MFSLYKNNFAYLCERPEKNIIDIRNKTKTFHVPQEKVPICFNHHCNEKINKSFKKTTNMNLFHHLKVNNNKLMKEKNNFSNKIPNLDEIVLKKKKIKDIISIYKQVKNIYEQKELKNEVKEKEGTNNEQKIKNKKLIEMIQSAQRRMYGEEKLNIDKIKNLFENNDFFLDLIQKLSHSDFPKSKSKSLHLPKKPIEIINNKINQNEDINDYEQFFNNNKYNDYTERLELNQNKELKIEEFLKNYKENYLNCSKNTINQNVDDFLLIDSKKEYHMLRTLNVVNRAKEKIYDAQLKYELNDLDLERVLAFINQISIEKTKNKKNIYSFDKFDEVEKKRNMLETKFKNPSFKRLNEINANEINKTLNPKIDYSRRCEVLKEILFLKEKCRKEIRNSKRIEKKFCHKRRELVKSLDKINRDTSKCLVQTNNRIINNFEKKVLSN